MSRNIIRKPSLKKSISAKYKGTYKRKIKKALIPGYGTRTAGWLHPKRKIYNHYYHKSSVDSRQWFAGNNSSKRSGTRPSNKQQMQSRMLKGLTFDYDDEKLKNHTKVENVLVKLIYGYEATYLVTRGGLWGLVICVLGNAGAPIDFLLRLVFIGFICRWGLRAVINSVFVTFS